MTWLAIDIGGANLKLADTEGCALSESFALWQHAGQLNERIQQLLSKAPSQGQLAVTMTGELADCFQNKSVGVLHILDAVAQATTDWIVRVYLTDGRLVPLDTAVATPLAAAASNWLALATFAGRFVPDGNALLFDVGSTTCDIVPLIDGKPQPAGRNDTDRLLAGELVYTGVERSPVCAVVRRVPYRGSECPVAQELFATMRDVYLITEDLLESPTCHETADGRPATREYAVGRLGRVVCADETQFTMDDAIVMSTAAIDVQVDCLVQAFRMVINRMPAPPQTVITSGHGDFLLRRLLDSIGFTGQVIKLSKQLGEARSRVAPASALATLASEMVKT